jgi:hypothetical protein
VRRARRTDPADAQMTTTRLTAAERREAVLEAAMTEFA